MDNTRARTANRARVKRPERSQVEWRPVALDQLLPADHRARVVWAYVDSLDCACLYAKIQAVEGTPGRDAVDPKILLALWMFATVEGISSARQIARLCERDLAYMWLRGGVGVNYHLLSDFYTACGAFLDQLLTDTIATLMHQGLVTLETVAQDGMRVRANAGSSSFRRRKTLEKHRQEAGEQVEKLRAEREAEEGDGSVRPSKYGHERNVRLPSTHGHGRSEDGIPPAPIDRGVPERRMSQPRLASVSRPRSDKRENLLVVVCDHLQLHADDQPWLPADRTMNHAECEMTPSRPT